MIWATVTGQKVRFLPAPWANLHNMTGNPDEHQRTHRSNRSPPLWRLAFRAGFLLAAAFAVVGMARWLYWMLSPASWDYSLAPNWWHAHEMVFGFAMPVVAGFLLTAVATWTGIPGTSGRRLQLLFGLWLLARMPAVAGTRAAAAGLAGGDAVYLLIIFELTNGYGPGASGATCCFRRCCWPWRMLRSASYWNAEDPLVTTRLHYGAVWMITVLVVIIGGRVIPDVHRQSPGLQDSPAAAWLRLPGHRQHRLIGLVLAICPGTKLRPGCATVPGRLRDPPVPPGLLAGLEDAGVPLLWSMHLSYLCIPLAMLGLALAGTDPVASKNVMHLLAIGTIGGMILAMMSRVSLGHTGRPLEVPTYLAWAFALVYCLR